MMLNYQLARNLMTAGAIHENTELTTYYDGTNIDGMDNARRIGRFHVKEARATKDSVIFKTFGEGRWLNIRNEDVIDVDGMSPDRFAQFHGFKKDGEEKPKLKRRGRRTNKELALRYAEQEDAMQRYKSDED